MTDPATLAHAVLDTVVPDVPWKIQLQEFQARAAAAPTLARAVIELTAKVERVEALAETWEEAARLVEARGGDAETVRDLLQDIRDALNGENA